MSSNGHSKDKNIWTDNPRWKGVTRPYSMDDVERLRGTGLHRVHARPPGAERLWDLLHADNYVPALGALTGNQAVQQVQAGLKAIYVSGWQVAADANLAGTDVSRSESISGQQRSRPGAHDQ